MSQYGRISLTEEESLPALLDLEHILFTGLVDAIEFFFHLGDAAHLALHAKQLFIVCLHRIENLLALQLHVLAHLNCKFIVSLLHYVACIFD